METYENDPSGRYLLGDEPLPGKASFFYLSNLILALLCAITFAIMTVLTFKVSKLVWD